MNFHTRNITHLNDQMRNNLTTITSVEHDNFRDSIDPSSEMVPGGAREVESGLQQGNRGHESKLTAENNLGTLSSQGQRQSKNELSEKTQMRIEKQYK